MLGKIIAAKIASKLFEGSKNTVANGLRQNMGSIGGFVADRMQREKTDNEHTTTTKKSESIPGQTETKINPKASTTLDEVAKQVQNAVGVTVNTTKKGFVFVGKHMDGFSNEVSRSLESLGNLLNRLLYLRNKRPTSSPLSFFQEKKKKDNDDGGMDWLSILGALYSARKVIRFLRNGKLLSRLLGGGKAVVEALAKPSIMKKMLGPALAPLKMFRFLGSKVPILGTAFMAYDLYDANTRDATKETGGDILSDYAGAALSGGIAGAVLGPWGIVGGALGGMGLMFLSRSFRKTGNVNSLEVNKIVFDADKIKFDILNTLEFKQRVPDSNVEPVKVEPVKSAGSVNDAADKLIGGRGGPGSLNTMADNARGGPGGPGAVNSYLDSLRGGPGGAGMFNTFVDKIFGTGQKSSVASNNKSTSNSVKTFSKQQALPTSSMPVTQSAAAHASSMAVDNAMKLIGANENANRKEIREYLANGGVNLDPKTTAWCAAFVNSSLQQQGLKGSGSQAAGSFQNFGEKVDLQNLRKGDVLVNHKYSPRTGMEGSHVGIATGNVKRDEIGNIVKMEMLSGNDKDSVRKSWVIPGSIGNQYSIRRANKAIKPIQEPTQEIQPIQKEHIQPIQESPKIQTQPPPVLIPPQIAPKDLTPLQEPEEDGAKNNVMNSPAPTPKKEKQSFYQDNDLDHRTEKRVKETRTFAMYFSTANNTEDA